MKLKDKMAVKLSIKLWTWLEETGLKKEDWPGWVRNGGRYSDDIDADCFLCDYQIQEERRAEDSSLLYDGGCVFCPYRKKFGCCLDGVYVDWDSAKTETARKKYAKQFLGQLKEVLSDMESK